MEIYFRNFTRGRAGPNAKAMVWRRWALVNLSTHNSLPQRTTHSCYQINYRDKPSWLDF